MNFMFFWRPANCISVVLLNVVFLFVGKIKWWWWWCLFPHSTMSSPPRTFAATGILFRACPSVGAWVCESVRPENSRQNKTKNDTYCTIFCFYYILLYSNISHYIHLRDLMPWWQQQNRCALAAHASCDWTVRIQYPLFSTVAHTLYSFLQCYPQIRTFLVDIV